MRAVLLTLRMGCQRDGIFNKAWAVPWCHAVVHLEVKMNRSVDVCQDDGPNAGSTSAKQAVFFPRLFPVCQERAGPTSVLV